MSEKLKVLGEIAEMLRDCANRLDQCLDDEYRGENPNRMGSSGDVVAGREVEDITENDIADAVKIIKIGL